MTNPHVTQALCNQNNRRLLNSLHLLEVVIQLAQRSILAAAAGGARSTGACVTPIQGITTVLTLRPSCRRPIPLLRAWAGRGGGCQGFFQVMQPVQMAKTGGVKGDARSTSLHWALSHPTTETWRNMVMSTHGLTKSGYLVSSLVWQATLLMKPI
jgi:hypothetical protein